MVQPRPETTVPKSRHSPKNQKKMPTLKVFSTNPNGGRRHGCPNQRWLKLVNLLRIRKEQLKIDVPEETLPTKRNLPVFTKLAIFKFYLFFYFLEDFFNIHLDYYVNLNSDTNFILDSVNPCYYHSKILLLEDNEFKTKNCIREKLNRRIIKYFFRLLLSR